MTTKGNPADLQAALDILKRLDAEQLDLIERAARDRRVRLASFAISIGTRVSFGRPNGRKHLGTVERINQSTVSVKGDDGRGWRVPLSMLTVIAA